MDIPMYFVQSGEPINLAESNNVPDKTIRGDISVVNRVKEAQAWILLSKLFKIMESNINADYAVRLTGEIYEPPLPLISGYKVFKKYLTAIPVSHRIHPPVILKEEEKLFIGYLENKEILRGKVELSRDEIRNMPDVWQVCNRMVRDETIPYLIEAFQTIGDNWMVLRIKTERKDIKGKKLVEFRYITPVIPVAEVTQEDLLNG